MPLHEYQCEICGKVYEFLVSGFDSSEVDKACECGGELRHIFSATASITGSSKSEAVPACGANG